MDKLLVEIRPETEESLKQLLQRPAQQETGGIVLGKVEETEQGLLVDIAGVIGANPRESFIKEFHYSHAIWRELYELKAEQYPELEIVGWFHSSSDAVLVPGANDLAIHKAYFKEQHQVLLLADTTWSRHCIFKWEKNYLVPLNESEDEPDEYTTEHEGLFAAPSKYPELAKEAEMLIKLTSQVNDILEQETEEVEAAKPVQEPLPLSIKLMAGLAGLLTLVTLLVYPLIKTADYGPPVPNQTASDVQNNQDTGNDSSGTPAAPDSHPAEPNASANRVADIPASTSNSDVPPTPTQPGAQPSLPAGVSTAATKYVVQQGDSLWSISQKLYGSGLKCYLLIQANGLTTPNRLNTGLVLEVPPDK